MLPNEANGCRRKIAARLMLRISRNNSRNCLNIPSALSEWVNMAEKSRNTPRVWAGPDRPGESDSPGRGASAGDRGAASGT
jgi:hypothetical protein